MSPRTLLALPEVEARWSAIAKLSARSIEMFRPVGLYQHYGRSTTHRTEPPDSIGHALQHAAAENA